MYMKITRNQQLHQAQKQQELDEQHQRHQQPQQQLKPFVRCSFLVRLKRERKHKDAV